MSAAATVREHDPGLLPALEQLRRDGDGLLAAATLADLAAAAERLEQARCNVVVLGAFKRGKSALLNALLGREVLPVGVLPLTSVVTVLRHGEAEAALVRYDGDRVERHPVDALADFVTEPANPHNRRGVATVEVLLDHPLLSGGLQLVDTPGIASIHRHNTRAAYEVLGRVDAALCVVSADQPLSEAEADLYRAAAERAGRMLWILSKADQLNEHELAQARDFVAAALDDEGLGRGKPSPLAVSAIDGRGLPELRERFSDLAAYSRDTVIACSAARTALGVASELETACKLEERALTLPLEDLCSRAAILEERLEELHAAGADADDLMGRRTARFLDEHVNAPLLDYAREHADLLYRELDARADELADRSPRRLAEELDAWIDETVRDNFAARAAELRELVTGGLTEVAAAHGRRIERILREVHEAAAEVLGVAAPDRLPEVAALDTSGFTFKLHDPQHALDTIVGASRRSLPGKLGRRLVIADARERLRSMTDRHAGRLRSELVTRAQDAIAEHRRALDAALEQECAAVRGAIERAASERASGEQATRARLEQLEGRRSRAAEIARALAPEGRS